jgi:hypothetical protein
MPAMPAPSAPPVVTAPASTSAPTSSTIAAAQPAKLSDGRLDQLIAPVALYPDPLLGQVLMASTYPVEIVEAAHWASVPANRTLAGATLETALKGKGWDASVMSLVPFPQLLALMADKVDWTERLGAAFLAQPADMISGIQRLRRAALAVGRLKATPECHCIIQTTGELIAILPSDGDLVSLPIYDPASVYGHWADASDPPIALPAPSGSALPAAGAVGFTPPVVVALYGPLWGWSSIDWAHQRIAIDNARYAAIVPGRSGFAGGTWIHDSGPRHILVGGPHPVVAHNHPRHAVPTHDKKLAMVRPPHQFASLRHRSSGLPPGTILPPPPPAHHAALGWPYSGFGRY